MLDLQNQQAIAQLKDLPPAQLAHAKFSAYIGMQVPNYKFSLHNLAIANVLERVESGHITRLIVNMPPRHGKTMQISELFPAWYMGRHPEREILFATYSFDRSGDCGRKVRNQMTDPYHKIIFPDCEVSKDAAGANRMMTKQGGAYVATGVGGGIVGRGANLFIIDDPISSREDADSDTSRKKLLDWYRGVAYTRLMNPNVIILVMTRWHFDDLAGFLLEEMQHEGWAVLKMPAIADGHDDPIGRQSGEALWPTEYGVERLRQIKTTIGTREWNAQYQQIPMPDEGSMINIKWFKRYPWKDWLPWHLALQMGATPPKELPFGIRSIVMSWDTAYKEAQINDPSALTIWGVNKNHEYRLLGTINERMNYPKLKKRIIKTWQNYSQCNLPGPIPLLIEDKASGQSLIHELRRFTGIPVIAINPDANKQTRMSAVTPLIESGRVFLPDGNLDWVMDYESQLARFPLWKWDDLVDSTSQFLGWIYKPRYKKNRKLRFWK
jgi:predicted phage terminase large subunit-like protein